MSFTTNLLPSVRRKTQAQVYNLESPERSNATAFIRSRFAASHGAEINHFMPNLLTVGGQNIEACVGIRSASKQLFIEAYLDLPLSQAHPALAIERTKIAEVGNLVSVNRHSTLQLFVLLTSLLDNAGFEEVVFCATKQVASILKRAGADPHPIVEADGNRMGDSLAEWGTYYDNNPVVMRLNVASLISVINNSPMLLTMAQQFRSEIPELTIGLTQ